jgi:glucokinase
MQSTNNPPHIQLPRIHLPPGAAPLACVDIGGTKVAVSVVDEHGMRAKLTEPTAKEGNHGALAAQVIRMVGASCAGAGVQVADLAAVGVASCGPFVMRDGCIELAAPNICGALAGQARGLPNNWHTALLEAPLRQAFARVRVENDCVAALEAERRWGALQTQTPGRDPQPLAHCAYVTWSTGIGVGLCVDGHVLRGKNGNAGHAGHTFVSDNPDALCGCGNLGDVEGLIAGNAIGRRFAAQGYADCASLFVAAYAGDGRAIALIDELCRVMGRTLYNLVVTLDLQRVSVGGSVFWHHRDYLLPRLRAHIAGKLAPLTEGVQVVAAGLGGQVGDYAALALVVA